MTVNGVGVTVASSETPALSLKYWEGVRGGLARFQMSGKGT